jgi:hypothetical protein
LLLPALISADEETPRPAEMVDAEVQVCLLDAKQHYMLPDDATALPGQLLQAGAEAITSEGTRALLQDHVASSQQAASVLAGLSAWLPQELLAAAEAAAAAAAATADTTTAGQADGTADMPAAADAEAAGKAAAAAAAAALVGPDLWREEARVAGSVAGLAVQLEDTWGAVLDELEAAEVSRQHKEFECSLRLDQELLSKNY